jgi:SAM-dependent methyltransferase
MSVTRRRKDKQVDSFYRAFEERYRGARELIRSRLQAYLPFIEPLRLNETEVRAVDLGCGRGEWLELLQEAGFDAHGVDLNEGMLAACRENGLQVTRGDAIRYLRELPDQSQVIVSGFHIAEHLPFTDLRLLVQQALRVLKPGGLLILETPNPENMRVGATSFYLDPTHQHPLPPGLLSFLPEYYGFARVKVIRLQESPELIQADTVTLNDVLGGVSPDYAVIAQKTADEARMTATGHAFEAEYGLTLESLVERFDSQLAGQVEETARLSHALDAARAEAASQGATFAKAISAWERSSSALTGEIALKNEAIAARDAEITRLNQRVAEIDAERHAAIARETALTQQLFARDAEIAALKAGETRLNQRVAEMDVEGHAALARETALTQQLAARDAEIAALKAGETALRAAAEQLARHREADRKASEQELKDKGNALALAEQERQAILASHSWRITRPLRVIGSAVRRVVVAPKRIATICLERLPGWLNGRPHLEAGTLRMLRLIPPLKRRLVTLARQRGHGSVNFPSAIPSIWGIDPDPNALTEWLSIIDRNK